MQVLKYGEEILAKVAEPVAEEECAELSQVLYNAYEKLKPIQGISLPQLGISKAGCLCKLSGRVTIMFNPKIVKTSVMKQASFETCLSSKDEYTVKRHMHGSVRYLDKDGKPQLYTATGFMQMRVIEHEIDHLNGRCLEAVGKLKQRL